MGESHIRLFHQAEPTHSISVPNRDPLKIGAFHGILAEVAEAQTISIHEILNLLEAPAARPTAFGARNQRCDSPLFADNNRSGGGGRANASKLAPVRKMKTSRKILKSCAVRRPAVDSDQED